MILEPNSRIECAQLGPRALGGVAPPVGRSLETRIVEQDRHTVARDLDIALENLGTARERGLEGGERVLGAIAGGSAVADHNRTIDVEKRVGHGREAIS